MDPIIDRTIGLGALVVAGSVVFFAVKLPNTGLGFTRKIFGFVIAGALALYGLYSLIAG